MSSQEHVATNTATTSVAVTIRYPATMMESERPPVFNVSPITISIVPPVAATEQQVSTAVREQQVAAVHGEEIFPPLPLSPIHANQIHGEAAQENTYDLPGNDHYPRHSAAREDNGRWLAGPFDRIDVGGRTFVVPSRLLHRYAFWRGLRTLQRPTEGWSFPNEDPNIFAIVLECIYSPSGYDGNEPNINMVKLMLAIVMVKNWDMTAEAHKLEVSVRRYIVRRILYRNPFQPDRRHVLDHNYYVYRSEEIYRTWKLLQRIPPLKFIVSSSELISLYITAIPQDMWPALGTNFDEEFTRSINESASAREIPADLFFENWWFRFFRWAGYLQFDWFNPEILDRYFFPHNAEADEAIIPEAMRDEFEIARARADDLASTYEARHDEAIRMMFESPDILRIVLRESLHSTSQSSHDTPITPHLALEEQFPPVPEVVEISLDLDSLDDSDSSSTT